MKKFLPFILLFFAGCLVFKFSDNVIRFTVDGEKNEWKNPISEVYYDRGDSSTYFSFAKIGEGEEIGISFKGNKTGTYIGTQEHSENYLIYINTASGTYSSNIFAAACTIKVTEYGGVGKRIKGNFSGKLYNPIDSTDYVIIKDGYFDAERGEDKE